MRKKQCLSGCQVTQAAFRGLDEVNLVNKFSQRACVMHTVPILARPFDVRCMVGKISEGHRVKHVPPSTRGGNAIFTACFRLLQLR